MGSRLKDFISDYGELLVSLVLALLLILGGYKLFIYIRWGLQDNYSVEARIVGFSWEREVILEWYDKDTCTRTTTDSATGKTRMETYDCSVWRIKDRYQASGNSKELWWPNYPEPEYRERIRKSEKYSVEAIVNDQKDNYLVGYEQWRKSQKNDYFTIIYNNFNNISRLEFE